LSEETKEVLYNFVLKILDPEKNILKIVKKEQLHITLFFFPKIDEEKLKNLYNVINNIKIKPFKIKIEWINSFDPNYPKVIFLDLMDQSGSILNLYNLLKDTAIKNGAIIEHRDFNPHLTVARVKRYATLNDYKKLSEIINRHIKVDFEWFVCNEVKVFKSELTQNGPIYTTLYEKIL
jgi:2'-5' RNA ligase